MHSKLPKYLEKDHVDQEILFQGLSILDSKEKLKDSSQLHKIKY